MDSELDRSMHHLHVYLHDSTCSICKIVIYHGVSLCYHSLFLDVFVPTHLQSSRTGILILQRHVHVASPSLKGMVEIRHQEKSEILAMEKETRKIHEKISFQSALNWSSMGNLGDVYDVCVVSGGWGAVVAERLVYEMCLFVSATSITTN